MKKDWNCIAVEFVGMHHTPGHYRFRMEDLPEKYRTADPDLTEEFAVYLNREWDLPERIEQITDFYITR